MIAGPPKPGQENYTTLGTKVSAAALTGAFAIFFANPMVSLKLQYLFHVY
jgi:hypothetical protein